MNNEDMLLEQYKKVIFLPFIISEINCWFKKIPRIFMNSKIAKQKKNIWDID